MKMNLFKKVTTGFLTLALSVGVFSAKTYAMGDINKDKESKNIKIFEGKVAVGDLSLNAKLMGKGKVSVVFDSGYGDGLYTYSEEDPKASSWDKIQSEISKYATTIAYDRAGLGKSDTTANRPSLSSEDRQALLDGKLIPYDSTAFDTVHGKTALDKARNLHNLLVTTKVKAPYILVVHSISSLEAVEFAKLYPNELAGIVMVEGSGKNIIGDVYAYGKAYMPELIEPFFNQFTIADGTLDEELLSELQVKNAGDVLRNVPLTILSAEDESMGPEYHAIRLAEGQEWLDSSNYSKRIFVPNCGHYLHVEQPQYVIEAVKDMIKTVSIR